MLVSTKAMAGLASQLSVAVGVAAAGIVSQLAVASTGTPAKTGSVVSLTVITCVPLLSFPATSVAVQTLVME